MMVYLPCLGVVEVDMLRSTAPTVIAFGVEGVAETRELELLWIKFCRPKNLFKTMKH